MNRLRLYDFRMNFPETAVGICREDIASVARLANTCQRQLVFCREAGDVGWYGSWSTMVFTVSQTGPYITPSRHVARLIDMAVCSNPIRIQNEFEEYLDFGNGLQPSSCPSNCNYLQSYTRNNVPTFVDLTPPGKIVRVRLTDPNDQGKRVFIGGLDSNNNPINELDNGVMCQGTFITLAPSFADSNMGINFISGIQKDPTFGPVKFYEVDLATGDEVLLLTMEPSEKVAWYRRYFINGLPKNCCNTTPTATTVQVTAMAKLELIDVEVDTDYLLLAGGGGLEALFAKAEGIRYSHIDSHSAKQMAQEKHVQAIRLLQGQLVHVLGKNRPAIGFMNSERRSLQMANISMT